jgi:hypothetical protein
MKISFIKTFNNISEIAPGLKGIHRSNGYTAMIGGLQVVANNARTLQLVTVGPQHTGLAGLSWHAASHCFVARQQRATQTCLCSALQLRQTQAHLLFFDQRRAFIKPETQGGQKGRVQEESWGIAAKFHASSV